MIDVGHVPDVRLEDEVVVLGSQGNETISADEIAKRVGTINYEIVSSLTSLVPKVYVRRVVVFLGLLGSLGLLG